jgi:hypothetical protein
MEIEMTGLRIQIPHLRRALRSPSFLLAVSFIVVTSCGRPEEAVVLRQIRDVVVDATTDPILRANAIFYNPNNQRGRLKKINIEIFVDGKKSATINQQLKTIIPAKEEFSIPLEVKISLKELGFMDTLLGVLGGKRFEIRYEGFLKLTYHGVPFNVPVKYKDEIRIRL